MLGSPPSQQEPGGVGGFPPTEGQAVPHSSPAQRRCVCWGSVPGEQGSEAEGKGSFGFHGRPVGEKTPQTGFQAPGAQPPVPVPQLPVSASLKGRR